MQKIRINNKFFRSLSDAARFLGMNKGWLSNEMKDKQAITYKDLLVEKIDTPKTNKIPKHTRKGIPVIVDGIAYKNCAEAERAIGCAQSSLSDALRRGAKKLLGHTIEPVYPSMINKKRMNKTTNIKVLCKTTGVTYDSIREAALVAGVDDWTMSKKMEFAGSFIDNFGNEYKRLTPMDTKNTYRAGNKTVGRYVQKQYNNIEKKDYIYADLPKAIKELVDEKISDMFESGKSWQEIKDFAKKVGCKQIILKVEDDEK